MELLKTVIDYQKLKKLCTERNHPLKFDFLDIAGVDSNQSVRHAWFPEFLLIPDAKEDEDFDSELEFWEMDEEDADWWIKLLDVVPEILDKDGGVYPLYVWW